MGAPTHTHGHTLTHTHGQTHTPMGRHTHPWADTHTWADRHMGTHTLILFVTYPLISYTLYPRRWNLNILGNSVPFRAIGLNSSHCWESVQNFLSQLKGKEKKKTRCWRHSNSGPSLILSDALPAVPGPALLQWHITSFRHFSKVFFSSFLRPQKSKNKFFSVSA